MYFESFLLYQNFNLCTFLSPSSDICSDLVRTKEELAFRRKRESMCVFKHVVCTLEYPLSCKIHTDVPTHFNDERKQKAYMSSLSNHLSEDIH